MKYFSFFCLLIFRIQAQSFTATWSFNGNANASSNSANVSATNASLTGANESGYPAGCTANAWSVNGWKSTFQADEYMEVSVTPANGYKISVSNISCNLSRSNTGPTTIYLRSNQDAFTSDIATNSPSTNCGGFGTGLAFNDRTSTITFRFYTSGASAGLGTIRFDDLVISGTVSAVALPVLLNRFDAEVENDAVVLNWGTFVERNADYFKVERQTNKGFETIGTIPAKGNSYEQNQYVFRDTNPFEGWGHYRLGQVDFDGSVHYSKTISAYFEPTISEIYVENPVRNQQIFVRCNPEKILDYTLYDTNGNRISVRPSIDAARLFLQPEAIQQGVYVLHIQKADGGSLTKRLLFAD